MAKLIAKDINRDDASGPPAISVSGHFSYISERANWAAQWTSTKKIAETPTEIILSFPSEDPIEGPGIIPPLTMIALHLGIKWFNKNAYDLPLETIDFAIPEHYVQERVLRCSFDSR